MTLAKTDSFVAHSLQSMLTDIGGLPGLLRALSSLQVQQPTTPAPQLANPEPQTGLVTSQNFGPFKNVESRLPGGLPISDKAPKSSSSASYSVTRKRRKMESQKKLDGSKKVETTHPTKSETSCNDQNGLTEESIHFDDPGQTFDPIRRVVPCQINVRKNGEMEVVVPGDVALTSKLQDLLHHRLPDKFSPSIPQNLASSHQAPPFH